MDGGKVFYQQDASVLQPGHNGSSSFTLNRKFERKSRAFAKTVAMRRQAAAHLMGCQHAAVQAETVTVFARRESMCKDTRQVFGWNTRLSRMFPVRSIMEFSNRES